MGGPPAHGSFLLHPPASILIVRHDRADLREFARMLQPLRQQVLEVNSIEQALPQVQTQEFAVVLLTLDMPELNAFAAAEKLREHQQFRHTPIIFLSDGAVEQAVLERAYALGAVDVLVKPFVPTIVRAKITGLIQIHQDKMQARREAGQLRLLVHATVDYAIFMLDPLGHILEKTVLVALTGWGQPEDRRRTAEAGFHHHVVKPPDPATLETLLAHLPAKMR